jgi:hypothetical protein
MLVTQYYNKIQFTIEQANHVCLNVQEIRYNQDMSIINTLSLSIGLLFNGNINTQKSQGHLEDLEALNTSVPQ